MGNDLTFIQTSELIDELNRRHDALIVLGMRFNSKDAYGITRFHQGHRYVCLGLLSNATAMINEVEMAQLKKDNA